jgi:hypothetical protein
MARKPLRDEIKPVKPHLTRGTGGVAAEVMDVRHDLQRVTDRIEDEFVMSLPGVRQDLWVDGTSGDDANDGLTEATAVKTIPKLKELIADRINVNYFVVNLRGVVTLTSAVPDTDNFDYGNSLFFNTMNPLKNAAGTWQGPTIVVQGDPSPDSRVVLEDDGAGGDIVSDINGVGQIGLSTKTWTNNQWKGYWCRVKTGALAGQEFIIDENDGTTLYMLNPADVGDPGAGAEFDIVRPGTEITAAHFYIDFVQKRLQCIMRGPGKLYISHLYISGGATLQTWTGEDRNHNNIEMSNIIFNNPNSLFGLVSVGNGGAVYHSVGYMDCSGDTPVYATSNCGLSQPADSLFGANLFVHNTGYKLFNHCLLGWLWLWSSDGDVDTQKTKFRRVNLMNSLQTSHGGHSAIGVGTKMGGGPIEGNTYRPALYMFNSDLDVDGAGVEFDYATIGARLVNSVLTAAELGGTNNADAGVHADMHSSVCCPVGFPTPTNPKFKTPTLSGNGGTVELSKDGVAQISTWQGVRGTQATGTIDCDNVGTGVLVLDGETVVINDGSNTVTFEFDNDGSVVESAILRQVDISGPPADEDDVKDLLIAAINAAALLGFLQINAWDGGPGIVSLTHQLPVVSAGTVTDTVVNAQFTTAGMSGGVAPAPVSDPEICARPNSPLNFYYGV